MVVKFLQGAPIDVPRLRTRRVRIHELLVVVPAERTDRTQDCRDDEVSQ